MNTLEDDWNELQNYFKISVINDIEMPVISIKKLADICMKDVESIEYIINRTGRLTADIGIKKTYNKGLSEKEIGIVSIYFITLYYSEADFYLTKFKDFFKEEIFEIGLKAIGNLVSKRTAKRYTSMGSPTGMSYEDLVKMNTEKKISDAYKYPDVNIEDKSHHFYSKKVVITGTFNNFPMRDEMAKMLHSVGADVNMSISKKTDFVIVGENAGPKKLEKIEELQITIISEEEFINLFKNE